jgi:hypothetical protein
MNKRIEELAEQAFHDTALYGGKPGDKDFDQRYNEKFAELMVKDFYNICDQAWAFNEKEKSKEGATQVEQLVFAGAMAQCQKMKENIEQQFGVKE